MSVAILIHGKKQRGKDVVAKELKKHFQDFDIIHFADTLKEYCLEFTNCKAILDKFAIPYVTSGAAQSPYDIFSLEKSRFYEAKSAMSRALMQDVGALFRKKVNSRYWAEDALKRAYEICKTKKGVIIADTRFENEITQFAVSEFNPFTIKITRPESDEIEAKNPTLAETHESEVGLDNYSNWDYEIVNDGTLHDLESKVLNIVEDLKKKIN